MPIKSATPEQIAALKEKLQKSKLDRLYESQMDEVVNMVGKHKRPFAPAPKISRKAVHKALIATAAAFSGALLWNITGSIFGLLLFAAAAAASVTHYKSIQ